MADQASGLRRLAAAGREGRPARCLPALAVTGGKGGVGKTCVAVNLGILLARMGLKPLLVDCDLGLANADVLLGCSPGTTLCDVVLGDATLNDALVRDRSGLHLLPAASGREELSRLEPRQMQRLLRALAVAANDYDLLILDTAAGIGREVMAWLEVARTVLVVVSPEPTSLTDAYALIKLLAGRGGPRDVRLLVNQAANAEEGVVTANRLRKVASTYLGLDPPCLGCLPADRHMREAVRHRRPVAHDDTAPVTQALKGVAIRLKAERWKE